MLKNPQNPSPGRPPTLVRGDFYEKEPTLVMAVIVAKKNKGLTWQQIADELAEKVEGKFSPALIYLVAKGRVDSDRVEQALGLAPITAPIEVCPECGKPHRVPFCTEKHGQPVKPAPPKASKPRTRIAADVTKARRQALHDMAAQYGLSWSEYCNELADRYIEDNEGLYF